MKGPREYKKAVAKLRKYCGKANGVIGSWAFDHWFFERPCKKDRKTHRRPRDGYVMHNEQLSQKR